MHVPRARSQAINAAALLLQDRAAGEEQGRSVRAAPLCGPDQRACRGRRADHRKGAHPPAHSCMWHQAVYVLLASGLLANNGPSRPAPDVVLKPALSHKPQTHEELWQIYGMQHLFFPPSPVIQAGVVWQVVNEVDAKYTVMAKSSKVRADL